MYSPENLLKALDIRLMFLDIDGVFTDGRLIFSETHESLKQFNVLDGQGIKWLQMMGITPVVISGRSGLHVEKRLKDLGVEHIHMGVDKKIVIAENVLKHFNINWHQVASMGDDWPDLQIIIKSGFSCAPINAHKEVLTRVNYISPKRGGDGAVRDVCDLLLTAKGKYNEFLDAALGIE